MGSFNPGPGDGQAPAARSPGEKHPSVQKGMVLEIQRMSTEDGPGLRTTVFMKGCPLACQWCHNPESIAPHPQIHWIANQCIGCKTCLEVCPTQAISLNDKIETNADLCIWCCACVKFCPQNAREMSNQVFVDIQNWLIEKCEERREPELFL